MAVPENNEQQQLSEGFANSCYKIVSIVLLQELINDFAVVWKTLEIDFISKVNLILKQIAFEYC